MVVDMELLSLKSAVIRLSVEIPYCFGIKMRFDNSSGWKYHNLHSVIVMMFSLSVKLVVAFFMVILGF